MEQNKKNTLSLREIWVDNVKVLACVLVVLGHLFQSLVKANVLPNNDIYQWLDTTIYYFHVPLFFICSGYLYQRNSIVDSFETWKHHVIKKAVILGIPYVAFSLATWILKQIFSNSVNSQIDEGIFHMLLLHPTSPYWYLYALFFIFLITPTFYNARVEYITIFISIVFRLMNCFNLQTGKIAFVGYIFTYEIWFVLGMIIAKGKPFNIKKVNKKSLICGAFLGLLFLLLSVAIKKYNMSFNGVDFAMTSLACASIILIVGYIYRNNNQGIVMGFLAKYTMPIFLMHTLCAAPIRVILIKANVINSIIHIIVGLGISILGPVIIAGVMKRIKYLEILIYPEKYI